MKKFLSFISVCYYISAQQIDYKNNIKNLPVTDVTVQYKAKGDGTTNDSAAIQSAVNSGNNKTVFVPPGTYILGTTVTLNSTNITLNCAPGAIFKAKSAANLDNMFIINGTGFKTFNCKWDGNGTGTSTAAGTAITILTSAVEIGNSEITNVQHAGIAWGGTVNNINVHDNWIHDNKNSADHSFSYGIQSVSGLSSNIRITNNTIENNYPTGTISVEGGAAICLDSKDVMIANNYIKNNYNFGGQLIVCGNHQGMFLNWSVIGNKIILTNEIMSTSGIEWVGVGLNTVGNTFNGGAAGIVVQSVVSAGAGYLLAQSNVFINVTTGILLVHAPVGLPFQNIISNNIFNTVTTGINVPSYAVYTIIRDNSFKDAVTIPILNFSASTYSRGNIGGSGLPLNQGCTVVSVTASPFSYASTMQDETVYINGGTISDITIDSVSVSAHSVIPLNPNQILITTYSVAPTMKRCIR